MNIGGGTLRAQYDAAILRWPFLHRLESDFGLPKFLLAAVGSRETNLRPEFANGTTGDGGHGHGIMQLDDRWHVIPPGFDFDARAQFIRAAEMLAGLIEAEDGDVLGALNRYNSGSPRTFDTTGHDYGPDVLERRDFLAHIYPIRPEPDRPKEVAMLTYTDSNGLIFLIAGGLHINVPNSQDFDRLCNNIEFLPNGLPKLNQRMSPEWRPAVERAVADANR